MIASKHSLDAGLLLALLRQLLLGAFLLNSSLTFGQLFDLDMNAGKTFFWGMDNALSAAIHQNLHLV
jgi:hypothetical protein